MCGRKLSVLAADHSVLVSLFHTALSPTAAVFLHSIVNTGLRHLPLLDVPLAHSPVYQYLNAKKLSLTLDDLTYALTLPVEPQTTDHSTPSSSVSCCCLHLSPAVPEAAIHTSCSRSLFQVFVGRPLPLRPSDVCCSASAW